MLQVSPEVPPKYKRRNVSAIRHFPRGCVPTAVKLDPKAAEGTFSPVALENGKVTETDMVLFSSSVGDKQVSPSPSVLEEKALIIPGSSNDLVPEAVEPTGSSILPEHNPGSNSDTVKEEVQVVLVHRSELGNHAESNSEAEKLEAQLVLENSNPVREKVEMQQVIMENSEPCMLQNRHCYLKMYAPPRRRKVSAIRNFPPRCGPAFAAPTSLSDKNLVMKKIDEVIQQLVDDVSVKDLEGRVLGVEMRSNDGKEVVQEIDERISSKRIIRADASSLNSKFLQQEMAGGSTLVTSTKKNLHVKENTASERQSILVDDSVRISNAEKTKNREKSIMKQSVIDGPEKVSSSEKFGAADRKDSRLTKDKELTIPKGAIAQSNSDKSFRIEGSSSHGQIKSSLKSGSNWKTLLKSESNELLVRSSSNKTLEGYKVQTKANASSPSSFVVNSQSGSRGLDKRDISLMGKQIGKSNEVNQNSSMKRKLPAETPYKGYSPGDDADSLDAIGEKMIVLSLMSSKSCPWRNAMKRSTISSDSVVSKSKIRKERRFVDEIHTSKKYFSSQHKKKDLIEDDDDDDTPEEHNELSITMTPFVPTELSHGGGDNEEIAARHRVKRVLRLFQLICRKLLQGEESGSKKVGKKRIDLQASSILKHSGEWVNNGVPILGNVPGVEVGDEFHYRVELSIIGLHRPFQGGIDSTKINGMLLATSIVASDGYQDDMDSSDVLIYSGAGGTSVVDGDKQLGDQKLERGNLALKNSIDAQTPVRVIHGFKEKGNESNDARGKLVSTFTYDGIYYVESYWQEMGSNGFNVFKFQLRRMAQQPELAFKELKRSAKLKIREGLCVKDISQGKEKMGISVINTVDTDQPMPFKYITKSIYPSWYARTAPRGCDCTSGCSDSDKCACAVKNGGEIPFNSNGAIVQAKPLIYECGPSCKCFPSCHNRVSQRGIRIQLEIFKTKGRGWGVRSLKSIPSGTFICEYVGELLQDGDAEQRTNDEYLFDIGHNYDDRSLWAGLPNFIPGLQSSAQCDTVESVGFTIDAAEYGNVGRFINHSCSPNLYAQNVLYDHDDKRMPHIMFFAVDNIPPLQELTYHYNYTIGEVRDSEGNVKQKACHCGSPECCGRLY